MTQNSYQNSLRVEKNVGYVVKIIGPALEIEFSSGKRPELYNAVVVEGIDTNGLPITVRCEVVTFLRDTNRVLANARSYGHIRVGMKAIDTETSFGSNEEELVEVIHQAMLLTVARGTTPYYGFDNRVSMLLTVARGTPPYYGFDNRVFGRPIPGGEGRIIWCALLLYYAIQFFRRR